jgi:hypothetical protein
MSRYRKLLCCTRFRSGESFRCFPFGHSASGSIRLMVRSLTKSAILVLALGLWLLAASASWAQEDDLDTINQQIYKLFLGGQYQETLPLAEKVVELAKRLYGQGRSQEAKKPGGLPERRAGQDLRRKRELSLGIEQPCRAKVLPWLLGSLASWLLYLAGAGRKAFDSFPGFLLG